MAAMAAGGVHARLAERTDAAYAAAGSSPARAPSSRLPASALGPPCNSPTAHRFSPTRWLVTCLTSHSVHGVEPVHCSGRTAATYACVACIAWAYSSPLVTAVSFGRKVCSAYLLVSKLSR